MKVYIESLIMDKVYIIYRLYDIDKSVSREFSGQAKARKR